LHAADVAMPTTPPRVTVAIPTPFAADGAIDVAGLERIVAWLKTHGVQSIIPAGTTGEFAGMTAAERLTVLKATRQALGPSGFVFANCSACAIDDALDLAKQAIASGASPDGLLVLPPFYHKPVSAELGAKGCELFFRALLERLPAEAPPLYIYTFAMHTQQPVPPDVYGRLCKDFGPKMGGIKASAVSVEDAMAYAAAGPGTSVLVGNGNANLSILRAGLNIVSGDCVAVSWALMALLKMVEAGNDEGAERAQSALFDIWRGTAMNHFDEVPAVKAAFHSISEVAIRPDVRPPLVLLDESSASTVTGAMAKLREAFATIG